MYAPIVPQSTDLMQALEEEGRLIDQLEILYFTSLGYRKLHAASGYDRFLHRAETIEEEARALEMRYAPMDTSDDPPFAAEERIEN